VIEVLGSSSIVVGDAVIIKVEPVVIVVGNKPVVRIEVGSVVIPTGDGVVSILGSTVVIIPGARVGFPVGSGVGYPGVVGIGDSVVGVTITGVVGGCCAVGLAVLIASLVGAILVISVGVEAGESVSVLDGA
jgi:hypothetical protein